MVGWRCRPKVFQSAAGILPLAGLLLAGCATTDSLTRAGSDDPGPTVQVAVSPGHAVHLSSADEEFVIARAIAEHEMRRP